MRIKQLFQKLPWSLWLEGVVIILAAPFLLFTTFSTLATVLALCLIVMTWLITWRATRLPFPLTPFNGAVLLLAVMILVSVLVTADPDLTFPKVTGLILGLALWRYLACIIRDDNSLLVGVLAYAVIGGGMMLIGIISADWSYEISLFAGAMPFLPPQLIDLPGSPAAGVHMNNLAGVVALYIPLALMLTFTWRPPFWKRGIRLGLLLILGFLAALLLLTQSRSAWLGTAVGFLTLLIMWGSTLPPSRKRKLLWISLAVLTLAILIFGWFVGRSVWEAPPGQTVVGTFSTLSFRKEVWQWAVAGIQDFPFTGTGLGSFRRVVWRFYPLNLPPDYDIGHVHNIFFQVALDVGLPGITVLHRHSDIGGSC